MSEIPFNPIYRSRSCGGTADTTHAKFTLPVLVGEIKFHVGTIIIGFIMIVYGLDNNTKLIMLGCGLVGASIWLARHAVAGYINSDIILINST